MNTGELMQAVQDAGCEFDCNVVGDLYRYLRRRDEIWIMLPKAFAWVKDHESAPNNSRLILSLTHVSIVNDRWRVSSIYSKVDVIYEDPDASPISQRIPVAIELVESNNVSEEYDQLTHPGIITTFLNERVDEARRLTKEIKAAQVRIAAKEYEL